MEANDLIVITTHLNKAAFFMMRGARVVGFVGKRWTSCKIDIEISRKVLNDINVKQDYAVDDYRDYMKMRGKLKIKLKKFYNIDTYDERKNTATRHARPQVRAAIFPSAYGGRRGDTRNEGADLG